MQANTIEIFGEPIAYRESSGTGPALLLVHGNSSSSATFLPQLDSTLGERYCLVAIDLPGHGDSPPPTEPSTYSLPGYARVVRGVAEQLELEDAVFAGWSLGGHIILEAAPDLPGAAGFLIYGTPPLAFPPAMGEAFLPHPAMAASFKGDLTDEEMDAYVTAFFRPGLTDLPDAFRTDIRRADGNARAMLGASIGPEGYRDEVEIVATLARPLAVLHGEAEQLVSQPYVEALTMPTLWRGAIQIIEGAGHAPHWEQPARFNALLDEFIQACHRA